MPDFDLDLDALQAATNELGPGFRFKLREEPFRLPAALPLDALGPLLPVLAPFMRLLAPFLKGGMASAVNPADEDLDRFMATIATSPDVPIDLVHALLDAARRVVESGEEGQWARLQAAHLDLVQTAALVRAAWRFYGVSLGEVFRSAFSSPAAGGTSRQTSSDGTGSTPETPSGPSETPALSASVA